MNLSGLVFLIQLSKNAVQVKIVLSHISREIINNAKGLLVNFRVETETQVTCKKPLNERFLNLFFNMTKTHGYYKTHGY